MITIPSKIQMTTASKVTKLMVQIESFDLKMGFSFETILKSFFGERNGWRKEKHPKSIVFNSIFICIWFVVVLLYHHLGIILASHLFEWHADLYIKKNFDLEIIWGAAWLAFLLYNYFCKRIRRWAVCRQCFLRELSNIYRFWLQYPVFFQSKLPHFRNNCNLKVYLDPDHVNEKCNHPWCNLKNCFLSSFKLVLFRCRK